MEFAIEVSGDDAFSAASAQASYPGTANLTGDTDASLRCEKAFYTGTPDEYWTRVVLYRWDTSSIPDNAVITGATFRATGTAKGDANARSITQEWYAFDGSVALTDWTSTVGTDAHAGRTIASLSASADEDFPLLDAAAHINYVGVGPLYTGLRQHVSGGAPAAINYWDVAAWDHATALPPRLIVDFEGTPTIYTEASMKVSR